MTRSSCPGTCPLCYANRKGRSNYRGHWGYRRRPPLEAANVRDFMRRPVASESAPVSPADAVDLEFVARFPHLSERLLTDRWEDGGPRETDTLFVFHDGQRWKVMLKDRDGGRVAFVSSATFMGLFTALNAGLASSSLDWRADRLPKGKKK
jgi:hypothetical protein